MLVVVVHSLPVLEGYPLSTNILEIFFAHPLICTIGENQNHDIVLLFHSKDTNSNLVKLTKKCIHQTNTLVCEVSFYFSPSR